MKRGAIITVMASAIIAAARALATAGDAPLIAAGSTAAAAILALCWILADSGRSERLALIIKASRHTTGPEEIATASRTKDTSKQASEIAGSQDQ